MSWQEEVYRNYLKKKGLKEELEKMPSKKSKYGNKRPFIDGRRFDSQMEADYYQYLKILKKNGEVKDFKCQVRFKIIDGFTKNNKKYSDRFYVADFVVYYKNKKPEVVDVKGYRTQLYRIKKMLFEKRYPNLEIKEICNFKI